MAGYDLAVPDGLVGTFTPTQPLAAATQYSVAVTASDLAGNAARRAGDILFQDRCAARCDLPVHGLGRLHPPRGRERERSSRGSSSVPRCGSTGPGRCSAFGSTREPATPVPTPARCGSATGTRLATGTFTGETTSGWQTLTFATPVDVTAGHDVRRLLPRTQRPATPSTRPTSRRRAPTTSPARPGRRRRWWRTVSTAYGAAGFPTIDVQWWQLLGRRDLPDPEPARTSHRPPWRRRPPTRRRHERATDVHGDGDVQRAGDAHGVAVHRRRPGWGRSSGRDRVVGGPEDGDVDSRPRRWHRARPTRRRSRCRTSAGNPMTIRRRGVHDDGDADLPVLAVQRGDRADRAEADDTGAYEMGVRSCPRQDGSITGVRFYKGAGQHRNPHRIALEQHGPAVGDRHLHERDGVGLADADLRHPGPGDQWHRPM